MLASTLPILVSRSSRNRGSPSAGPYYQGRSTQVHSNLHELNLTKILPFASNIDENRRLEPLKGEFALAAIKSRHSDRQFIMEFEEQNKIEFLIEYSAQQLSAGWRYRPQREMTIVTRKGFVL